MLQLTYPPPLSLYIHIPWCIRKCPYCDFNSHEKRNELPEANYIDALLCDLDQDLEKIEKQPLISIFMGGGTPSLFSARAIEKLLTGVQRRLAFVSDIEITLEANPGTVEQKRFADFFAAGINRLSIGIQSFQDDKLKTLGRIHDAATAIKAAEAAHAAGFKTFNLDVMYGLPQQSLGDALYDLRTALSLKPTHLSWYQLTLEPNTFFHHQPPPLPDEDASWEIQQQGQALIAAHGFQQYEISAYSLPNHTCRHNLNYWQFGDYLGIGAGAHGKITKPFQQILRYWKTKHPTDYLNPKTPFIAGEKAIEKKDMPFEFMLNALRLQQPIPIALFEQRTGLALHDIEQALHQAHAKGLLTWDKTTISPTSLGKRFLNDLIQLFMPS